MKDLNIIGQLNRLRMDSGGHVTFSHVISAIEERNNITNFLKSEDNFLKITSGDKHVLYALIKVLQFIQLNT